MAVPHFNYYAPAGSIVDASDGRVTWNGRAWMLNGRVYGVPSSHRLIGRPGGPLAGWVYDWQRHAWMEPSSPQPSRPVSPPPPRPAPPIRPTLPRPAPPPPAPKPAPQTPAPVPVREEIVIVEKDKEHHHSRSPLDSLIKHPIAPIVGGVLVAAAYVTDEPHPPGLPDGLPEPLAKAWQMIYAQNQQRFQRRMDLYKDLGMVLLGYASAQTVIDALPLRERQLLKAAQ